MTDTAPERIWAENNTVRGLMGDSDENGYWQDGLGDWAFGFTEYVRGDIHDTLIVEHDMLKFENERLREQIKHAENSGDPNVDVLSAQAVNCVISSTTDGSEVFFDRRGQTDTLTAELDALKAENGLLRKLAIFSHGPKILDVIDRKDEILANASAAMTDTFGPEK